MWKKICARICYTEKHSNVFCAFGAGGGGDFKSFQITRFSWGGGFLRCGSLGMYGYQISSDFLDVNPSFRQFFSRVLLQKKKKKLKCQSKKKRNFQKTIFLSKYHVTVTHVWGIFVTIWSSFMRNKVGFVNVQNTNNILRFFF